MLVYQYKNLRICYQLHTTPIPISTTTAFLVAGTRFMYNQYRLQVYMNGKGERK